jgi:hypothetical protein
MKVSAASNPCALREAGFRQIEHFSHEQANDVYFRERETTDSVRLLWNDWCPRPRVEQPRKPVAA